MKEASRDSIAPGTSSARKWPQSSNSCTSEFVNSDCHRYITFGVTTFFLPTVMGTTPVVGFFAHPVSRRGIHTSHSLSFLAVPVRHNATSSVGVVFVTQTMVWTVSGHRDEPQRRVKRGQSFSQFVQYVR